MAVALTASPDAALEDLTISTIHRGDIVCRRLLVTPTGSVMGYVEADQVRNMGKIRGVVNAKSAFVNFENAKMYGNVFSASFTVHSKSTWEVASSHAAPFPRDSALGVPHASALERAAEESARRAIEAALAASPAVVASPAPETAAPSEPALDIALVEPVFDGGDETLSEDIAATLLAEMTAFSAVDMADTIEIEEFEEVGSFVPEEVQAPVPSPHEEAAPVSSATPVAEMSILPFVAVAPPEPEAKPAASAPVGAVRAVSLPLLFASAR